MDGGSSSTISDFGIPAVQGENRHERRTAYPSVGAPEVAEDGIEVARDAGTDARGVVVHGVSGETIKTGENQDERDKKDAA